MTIFLTMLLLSPLWAGEISDLIKDAPAARAYPEAGALILLERTVMRVDRDKNTASEHYQVVKIFEDRGKQEFDDMMEVVSLPALEPNTLLKYWAKTMNLVIIIPRGVEVAKWVGEEFTKCYYPIQKKSK